MDASFPTAAAAPTAFVAGVVNPVIGMGTGIGVVGMTMPGDSG